MLLFYYCLISSREFIPRTTITMLAIPPAAQGGGAVPPAAQSGGVWRDKNRNISASQHRREERVKKQNGEIQWFGLADPSNLKDMPPNAYTKTEQTKKDATEYLNSAFHAGEITIDWLETNRARSSGHLGDKQVLLEVPIKILSRLMNMSFHAGAVRDLLLLKPLLVSLSFIDH